jgi:hypothetical protein
VEQITHVIDCAGYSGQHETYLREVSVYDIKNDTCVNFDVLGFDFLSYWPSKTISKASESISNNPKRISREMWK